MSALQDRAACPDCGGTYALTKSGDLRRHACIRTPDSILIPLPWPTPPISPNDRQHWATKARATAQTKTEARWAIRAAKVEPIVGCEVTLHWRVPDHRRRDADNLAATKKAVTDALVAEGVLPDDSWVHVIASTERIHPPVPKMPGAMWLELGAVVRFEETA